MQLMRNNFERDGISFRYPANWQFELEEADSGWTASLQSPDTAFMVVSFDGNCPDPQDVAATTLAALEADYKDLDAEAKVENLAGCMAIGHDIEFFSFDLPNTCTTRTFQTDSGTVLVMCQMADLEADTSGIVLKAICQSLQVAE